MTPYRFRGHHTGIDLAATVQRLPGLSPVVGEWGEEEARVRLATALDAEGAARAEALQARIEEAVRAWDREARAHRRSKLRKGGTTALHAAVGALEEAARPIEDGAAMVQAAIPRGLVARLATRERAARVTSQGLEDLQRVLVRRIDPAVARQLATDGALAAAVARVLQGVAPGGSDRGAP